MGKVYEREKEEKVYYTWDNTQSACLCASFIKQNIVKKTSVIQKKKN